jgi:hypothetical protein
VAATLSFNNAMASMGDSLFSRKLMQVPALKLGYSEGQIGWIPYVRAGAASTYYYRQIFGCFFRDQHGIDAIDVVGPTT